ncbi:xanthine dehydrogenase accessory protein XdhC [Haematobacter massiliensis]|uniref:Molybdenum cofactor sulfurylase n=1 Tax=Haematobacter massiliensis TaxID=195105 RepID=A0A086XVC2_9RHOB|nr:xanthine dehydrogenase accessory protein XdhC [Haematobacter massiliensis]KFI25972.1 molybdenum cofactor sulfurylase [Haematobacter massiliensis]OWJ69357.1 xanthine dehydrogenase accessory protein XdhC [Haematobacter massiliensis]OWJ83853.1 xanthine dehydrogenase accessory protein XdhC [Haematobacter massiliensis]QBJ24608.1 xanthine dehydrogenase accessory protein XdhC [Haematobacter massiliensis]
MSFDRSLLATVTEIHGPVARIVVAEVYGSAPREAGTAMLVWADGLSGTIGGGALEWQAIAAARAQIACGRESAVQRLPLGPALGQCCGGTVTLVTEIWTAARLAGLSDALPGFARRVEGEAQMPLALRRSLAHARRAGTLPRPAFSHGWLIEPVATEPRALWIWGAGHVGRAIAAVLAPLPDFAITLIDTSESRMPESLPDGVSRIVAAEPARLVRHGPKKADHLIVTFSHEIDFSLCHALLQHGFSRCGLIGSATKWARFRSRLAKLGHMPAQIDAIACPIGDPTLGKHPQAIAVGVAAQLLKPAEATQSTKKGKRLVTGA